jgi:hypothetical protein
MLTALGKYAEELIVWYAAGEEKWEMIHSVWETAL